MFARFEIRFFFSKFPPQLSRVEVSERGQSTIWNRRKPSLSEGDECDLSKKNYCEMWNEIQSASLYGIFSLPWPWATGVTQNRKDFPSTLQCTFVHVQYVYTYSCTHAYGSTKVLSKVRKLLPYINVCTTYARGYSQAWWATSYTYRQKPI